MRLAPETLSVIALFCHEVVASFARAASVDRSLDTINQWLGMRNIVGLPVRKEGTSVDFGEHTIIERTE